MEQIVLLVLTEIAEPVWWDGNGGRAAPQYESQKSVVNCMMLVCKRLACIGSTCQWRGQLSIVHAQWGKLDYLQAGHAHRPGVGCACTWGVGYAAATRWGPIHGVVNQGPRVRRCQLEALHLPDSHTMVRL